MKQRIAVIMVCCSIFTAAHAERYAVLAGNATGKGGYAPLKYVENDIAIVKSILTDFCGFDKRNVVSLYNGDPEALDKLLSQCAAQSAATKNNMFLFYFSGHADQAALKMGEADYPLGALKEKLTAFPSDIRIGIFDACQSGSFTRIKGGTLAEPFLFKDDGKTQGQVYLSSSSISENAQESDALHNSVFTFHFINALRGSGDMSGDGRVTLSEAYQYAYNHTVSSTAGSSGGIQHPSYQFKIQGEGDIVLADLNVRSQGILLKGGLWGDITIFNERGIVVADLTKDKNSAVMIALGSGNYRLVATQNGSRLEYSVALDGRRVAAVKQEDFSEVKTPSSNKKGAGQVRRTVQLGVSLAGVYERFDLSSLGNGLEERFGAYRYFSLNPSFSFPTRIRRAAFEIETVIRRHFIGRIGVSGWTASTGADYTGRRLNEIDNAYYGCNLRLDKSISTTIVDFGTGYYFTQWILNHVSLIAGVSFYNVGVTVTSRFDDSLYNVRLTGTETVNGTILVPYVAAGYRWPLTDFCCLGAEVRYRYQSKAGTLDNSSPSTATVPDSAAVRNIAPLHCNFSGFDGRVFINFNFKFGDME